MNQTTNLALPPRGELRILTSDPGHVIAQWNPLLIAVFTRPPLRPEIDTINRVAAVGSDTGLRGGLLYVVARKELGGGVDPQVRAMFDGLIRRYLPKSGANAVVVLTRGFGAAIVRSVAAGFLILRPERNSVRVFDAVPTACTWLAKDHGLELDGLLDAYRRATRHLAETAG